MLDVKALLAKMLSLDSINLTSSYSASIPVRRRGGVAVLRLNLKDIPGSSNTVIATLPAGWRPHMDYVENIGHSNGSTHMRLYVRANGNIEVYNYGAAISGSANTQHTIMYFLG